jgi:LmbE family N-acetylglucosaminyl deacetylase
MVKEYPKAMFRWAVFSSIEERAAEVSRSADLFLNSGVKNDVVIMEFRNGYFPYQGAVIKDYFETLKRECNPDVVFTHYSEDRHQDHRLLSELTWNTFRDHLILEYEIPKYDGGMGSPNVFFPLAEEECQRKVELLEECFASERSKRWFSKETFLGLMRLRGVECNAPSGYAEGFYARKAVI